MNAGDGISTYRILTDNSVAPTDHPKNVVGQSFLWQAHCALVGTEKYYERRRDRLVLGTFASSDRPREDEGCASSPS